MIQNQLLSMVTLKVNTSMQLKVLFSLKLGLHQTFFVPNLNLTTISLKVLNLIFKLHYFLKELVNLLSQVLFTSNQVFTVVLTLMFSRDLLSPLTLS